MDFELVHVARSPSIVHFMQPWTERWLKMADPTTLAALLCYSRCAFSDTSHARSKGLALGISLVIIKIHKFGSPDLYDSSPAAIVSHPQRTTLCIPICSFDRRILTFHDAPNRHQVMVSCGTQVSFAEAIGTCECPIITNLYRPGIAQSVPVISFGMGLSARRVVESVWMLFSRRVSSKHFRRAAPLSAYHMPQVDRLLGVPSSAVVEE